MKQITIKNGKPILADIPKPTITKGNILVNVMFSCISQGTELSGIQGDVKNTLSEKIKKQTEKINKTVEFIKLKGINKTYKKVQSVLKGEGGMSREIGYSASGIVEEIGESIKDIKIGDMVCCAGAGFANHSEFISVPRNLVMKIPLGLDLMKASTVTLGGIALQGIRRADFKLGEFVIVIGLGFLGQLSVQMLKISGCRVIALDINDKRCRLAEELGSEISLNSQNYQNIEKEIQKITNGYGADGVIFTASTNDPSVISSAFNMCKKKGKVVLVGVAGDVLKRSDLYKKELDYLISTSYGPGRYDEEYELKGKDYPYAYVRWTENRNMQEYLRLLNKKYINIDTLIEKVYPIEKATEAYEELKESKEKPIVALFRYSENKLPYEDEIVINDYVKINKEIFNIALIGAGAFAQNMHIPNLQKMKDKYNLYAICDAKGLKAKDVAKQYKSNIATTNYDSILKDKNIDIVMICTRHNLHADYSIRALKAGKAVFVEKPIATNEEELLELETVLRETKQLFMVGFNRRFSPFAREIKKKIRNRINPMIISYRMNAGYIPLDHWVHTEEGAGRIIGEACHIIDLFNYLTDSDIISVSCDSIEPKTKAISSTDNKSITLKYKDGSIANLVYTSLGTKNYPKEHLELYCDETVYEMKDYLTLNSFGTKSHLPKIILKNQDKGHFNELIEFYKSLKGEKPKLPISIADMIQTTEATFLISLLD